MSPPAISRGGSPQDTPGAESQSPPKDAQIWTELVRARHEARILETLGDWYAKAPAGSRGIPIVTRKQQANLRGLVVDMFVELGEARLNKLLAQGQTPQQFEADCDNLIETEATEAQTRWESLMTRYYPGTQSGDTTTDPALAVHQSVSYRLKRVAIRYNLKAWSDYEKRLEATCVSTARALSDPSIASSELAPSARPTVPSSPLAQKVEEFRINKGLSIEKLAELANVDKKTLIGINKGRQPHTDTLKKIADALGVAATELNPMPRRQPS